MSKQPLVYLDYGHYDGINGHKSPDGLVEEWRIVRIIGYFLLRNLERLGIKVREVHPENRMITSPGNDLAVRHRRANAWYEKDKNMYECIFVSLHTDAAGCSGWTEARGATVHICDNSSDKSRQLAQAYANMLTQHRLTGNRKGIIRFNNFSVLANTHMPAVLVENLFIDNLYDCKILMDESEDNPLVNANLSAIIAYFVSLDEDLVWAAPV